MIGIYKITSPTGKVYIGQSVNIEKRLSNYTKLFCKNQTKLYNSLKKYGVGSHIFEIVEKCAVEELNIRERYWQEFYNVLIEGLNCRLTSTESKSGHISEETKHRISTYYKEFYQTAEGKSRTKQRLLNTDQVNKVLNTDYKSFQSRRIRNTDQLTRISNTDQVAKAKKLWVAVYQCTLDGDIVQEWNSVKQAGAELNICRGNISDCLRGRQRTAGGFTWKYKEC